MTGKPPVLDPDSAVRFLLHQGILDRDAVVTGDVTVEGVPRRNRNLRVSVTGGPGFFLKQPEDVSAHSRETLRAEAAFYRRYGSPPGPVAAVLPRLIAYEETAPLLVLELLSGHHTLREHCAAYPPDRFSIGLWRELGHRLGETHRHLSRDGRDHRAAPPWVLHAHRPAPSALSTMSQAGLAVLEIVQSTAIGAGLDSLAGVWRGNTLIHGDVRADNVLVDATAGGGGDLRLIDWEMCRPGDAGWDVAGFLEIGVTLTVGAAVDPDAGGLPPVVFQAASRAFWRGYVAARGWAAATARVEATHAAGLTAARIVQSVLEMTARQAEPPEPAVVLLQVCANILADPARATSEFFAIA